MNPNIRGLDLTLLMTLDALYDEGSVTRAADRLALSQPTVSGILNRLRAMFDDELYVRSSHGMVPTPRAEALAGPVKEVLRSTEALFEAGQFDPAVSSFDIRIGGTDYVNWTLFAPLVADLRRQAPGSRVSIQRLETSTLGQRQVLGEVDLLFFSHDPMIPDPEGLLIFEDTLVCVSSYAAHAPGQYVPLDELCQLSHVIGQSALRSSVSDRLATALRDRGLSRNFAVEVPDFASVFRVLYSCELVAFLPSKLVSQNGAGLKRLRVDMDIPAARVFARWHPRLHRDPKHLWLRDRVLATAQALDEQARGVLPDRPAE